MLFAKASVWHLNFFHFWSLHDYEGGQWVHILLLLPLRFNLQTRVNSTTAAHHVWGRRLSFLSDFMKWVRETASKKKVLRPCCHRIRQHHWCWCWHPHMSAFTIWGQTTVMYWKRLRWNFADFAALSHIAVLPNQDNTVHLESIQTITFECYSLIPKLILFFPSKFCTRHPNTNNLKRGCCFFSIRFEKSK